MQQRIQTLIKPILIENPVDLLYLTGLSLSKGRLYVSEKESVLFVDGRYFEIAKKKSPFPVRLWDQQNAFLKNFQKMHFDSSFTTCDALKVLEKNFPEMEWISISNPLKNLRLIKDEKEIKALQKAAKLTLMGIEHIISLLQQGISEEELALEFEVFCRKNGASGMSFEPIVAFGENSAYPHHRASQTKLKKDQVVLIDVGAIVDNYHGDLTRMHHFGKISDEILRLEKIVKNAQQKAISCVKPGVKLGTLDVAVREIFKKESVEDLFVHNLGHGLGLDTHEYPRIRFDGEDKDLVLKEGMVFTVEPGLYLSGLGGVRMEEMILVSKNGYKNLLDS
jgi:Xaa-Pro aminopeptidase